MKKLSAVLSSFFLISAFIVLYITYFESRQIQDTPEETTVLGEEESIETTAFEIEINSKKYQVNWFLTAGETLSLIPNFEEKLTSEQLMEENSCSMAVNAGFYSTDNQPIGFYNIDDEVISEYRENRLFNAIFSLNRLDTPRITYEVPQDPLKFGFQTGPILMHNDSLVPYSAETDKNARRMIAAITGENQALFITVYNQESVFEGPKIEELGTVLDAVESVTDLNIADAVNLDGGSASAFYSDTQRLKEISPVGSIICIK